MTSDKRVGDTGSTLVELMIAMLVLSIGVLAVLGALRVGVDSGRLQREMSSGELTLRTFAEFIEAKPYVGCADTGTYEAGFGGTDLLGGRLLPPPKVLRPGDPESPQVVYRASVDSVVYLQGGALDDEQLEFRAEGDDDWDDVCTPPDQGLQLIRASVRIQSAAAGEESGTVLAVSIVKAAG